MIFLLLVLATLVPHRALAVEWKTIYDYHLSKMDSRSYQNSLIGAMFGRLTLILTALSGLVTLRPLIRARQLLRIISSKVKHTKLAAKLTARHAHCWLRVMIAIRKVGWKYRKSLLDQKQLNVHINLFRILVAWSWRKKKTLSPETYDQVFWGAGTLT